MSEGEGRFVMRTITTEQDQILTSETRSDHVRVSIKDDSSNWIDMSDLFGHDYLEAADLRDDVDQPTMTANIKLSRDVREGEGTAFSLAVEMTDSLIYQTHGDLCRGNREVRIEAAVMPEGIEPIESDWINVFEGTTNDTAMGSSKDNMITLPCRDPGGVLMDQLIEVQRVYGDAGGISVEAVMQAILTDNSTGVTLWVPTSPLWAITEYEQQKEPVLVALRKLAQQIGWTVKYRWDSGTSAWRLKFYDPDRTKTTPDRIFSTTEYESAAPKYNTANIRNAWRVVYTDAADGVRKKIDVTDAPSIATYGRRFAEIAEDESSNIDSSSEATTMADAALADMKNPMVDQRTELRPFWAIETGDLYQYDPDLVFSDSAVKRSVVSWQTKWAQGAGSTTISSHGTAPIGQIKGWNGIEGGRPGGRATADFLGPIDKNQITRYSAAKGLGSHHLDPRSEGRISLVQNNDFGFQSRVTTGSGWPPDSWRVSGGDWGPTDDVYIDTATSVTGSRVIHFRQTTVDPVYLVSTGYIPVSAGGLYVGSLISKVAGTVAGSTHRYYVQWFDKDEVFISTTNFFNATLTNTAYAETTPVYAVAPATARWCWIIAARTVVGTAHDWYIDSVRFRRASPGFSADASSSQSVATGGPYTLRADNENFDHGAGYNNSTYIFTAPVDGVYFLQARIVPAGSMTGTSSFFNAYLQLNGTTFIATSTRFANSGGNVSSVETSTIWALTAGDTVEVQGAHNDAAARTLLGVYFNGQLVER